MNANETQVGGDHYRNSFQHWDLAHELDLGYFEGQITKYITRHRFKKGKEDLEKAVHFTQKLLELARIENRQPRHKFATMARMTQYAEANKLLPLEYACITSVVGWSVVQDLEMLEERLARLMRECYPTDGSEAGSGYVNQG